MDVAGVWSAVQQIMESLWDKFLVFVDGLGPIRESIVAHFGQTGLIATYIALGVVALLVLHRLLKITFAALKYLVVPSIVLAFVGTLILPYSFVFLLPITVSLCSLVLLFKA